MNDPPRFIEFKVVITSGIGGLRCDNLVETFFIIFFGDVVFFVFRIVVEFTQSDFVSAIRTEQSPDEVPAIIFFRHPSQFYSVTATTRETVGIPLRWSLEILTSRQGVKRGGTAFRV